MTFYDQKFGTPPRAPIPQPIAPKMPTVAPVVPAWIKAAGTPKNRRTFAYSALLTFSFVYFARPEDFVPGLALIPVAKISGFLALLGLLLSWSKLKSKMPLAVKLVLVLLAHMCLTVVFAFWRGGALDMVVNQFSKAAIVAVLISMIVNTLDELRKLLWVQCAAISVMTIAAIIIRPTGVGGGTRLWGLGGVFSNPNDLAISIAINFPLCLAMLLGSKGVLKKLMWAVAMVFLLYGVVATYSRSGLIAMVVCLMICVWEFGVKGKRPQLIVAAILVMLAGVGIVVTNPKYAARVETLVKGGDVEDSGDRGSLDARRELLMDSIRVTFQHPIFGVGPGNFQAATKTWHVTHNTYTELSSETGLPGLALFLAILYFTFRNLRDVGRSAAIKTNARIQLFTNALRAGMFAYIVGAAFASTTYNLFPYFMVGYAAALYKIGVAGAQGDSLPVGPPAFSQNKTKNVNGKRQEAALIGTR